MGRGRRTAKWGGMSNFKGTPDHRQVMSEVDEKIKNEIRRLQAKLDDALRAVKTIETKVASLERRR
jgi:hypothetical protein